MDVAQLLARRGTVYLLGAQDAQVAPLVTALTGHVARTARQLAASMPSGRLDPPLTLVLDEAALICPIPLDEWTADMGGRNITMHIAAQSRAQLRQRWQDTGAAAILNNAGTVLLFGGTRDPDDLQAYTTLVGDRDEPVNTHDRSGRLASTTVRRSPVLSAAQLAQLPAGRVVVIRRGMPPAIGTVAMAWQRRDVRHCRPPAVPGGAGRGTRRGPGPPEGGVGPPPGLGRRPRRAAARGLRRRDPAPRPGRRAPGGPGRRAGRGGGGRPRCLTHDFPIALVLVHPVRAWRQFTQAAGGPGRRAGPRRRADRRGPAGWGAPLPRPAAGPARRPPRRPGGAPLPELRAGHRRHAVAPVTAARIPAGWGLPVTVDTGWSP